MKSDINGCSTCLNGQENYEVYFDWQDKQRVQYDYRTKDGELFSCVRNSIEECRRSRDQWLGKRNK